MKTSSKSLGGQYERETAVKISKWLTESEEKLVCWRAPHSGSIGTVRKKKGLDGENVSGDFQCLDSEYEPFFNNFHCDSKSLGDVHLCLINPNSMKSSQLFENWRKVILDAGNNKFPIMLVKARNDRKIPEFMLLPVGLSFICHNIMVYYVNFDEVEYRFMLVLQNEFFKLNNWKELLNKNTLIKI